MKKDFRVYLDDIIESSTLIAKYIKGVSKEEFEDNVETLEKQSNDCHLI